MSKQIRLGWDVIEEPKTEPVSVEELSKQLAGFNVDELTASLLLTAARKEVEIRTGKTIGEQTIRMVMDRFPTASEMLPKEMRDEDGDAFILLGWPIIQVKYFFYLDTDGVAKDVKRDGYRIDQSTQPARLEPPVDRDWPKTQQAINAVTIDYVAGGPASEALRKAILLIAAHWYEHQNDPVVGQVTPIPMAALAILGN